MNRCDRLASFVFASFLLCAAQAGARDIYVSTSGRDTNAGDTASTALRTIKAASARAAAGDTVRILPGRYHEPIKPVRSGIAGKPIVYRSHGSNPAIITHSSARGLVNAIEITNLKYITIEGIHIDGVAPRPDSRVEHFATISGSSQIVIRDGNFRYAYGWHGIAVQNGSSFVTIEDNDIDYVGTFDSGASSNSDVGDAVVIGKPGSASRVLMRGNRLRHAGHNLLALYASSCVIEGNDFDNSWRDVRGGDAGGRAVSLMGSNNLFQLNQVRGAGASSDSATNMLIKVEGAGNIARQNVLRNGNGEGISTAARADQPQATQLRIYGNTMYRIGGPAWRLEVFSTDTTVGDNKFVNNLVVDPRLNPASPNSNSDVVFKVALSNAGPTARSVVLGNLISTDQMPPKAALIGFDGLVDISLAQTLYPQLFSANLAEKSLFVKQDPAVFADFSLADDSPAIDRGQFLTNVVGSGRAAQIRVRDSHYFANGFGLVPGDTIQLQGSTQRARVMQVDHSAGTLRLDKAIDFADGRGVALAYERSAPDVGAREFGLVPRLSPPTQVTAN